MREQRGNENGNPSSFEKPRVMRVGFQFSTALSVRKNAFEGRLVGGHVIAFVNGHRVPIPVQSAVRPILVPGPTSTRNW